MNIPAVIAALCGYYTALALAVRGYVIQGAALFALFSFFFVPCLKSQFQILKNLLSSNSREMMEADAMGIMEYVKHLTAKFKKLGYHISFIGCTEHEAELILTLQGTPKTLVIVRHSTGHTGTKRLGNLKAAETSYKCRRTMIVTNGMFTDGLKEYARKNDIILWDRSRMKRHLYGRKMHMIGEDQLPAKGKSTGKRAV